MPSELGTVVQWPDRHDPFIDRVAEEVIYQFTKKWKPDYDLHIGDNLDLGGISRFNVTNYKTQYEEVVIDGICSLGAHYNKLFKINPNGKKVWILGNHDLRLDTFVDQHPSWRGICDDIIGLLKFYGNCPRADEIEVVRLDDFEDDFHIGKMHFIHGYSSCKHVTAKMVEDYDESVTFGHAHTMQMFTKVKRKSPRAGYCIGHILNREGRKYLKGSATRWMTGFAFMEYNKETGEFTQHLLPIVNGKVRFAGKVYDGNKA